jgi:CTP:phosphocholine cytidylyltransferase-like protein
LRDTKKILTILRKIKLNRDIYKIFWERAIVMVELKTLWIYREKIKSMEAAFLP